MEVQQFRMSRAFLGYMVQSMYGSKISWPNPGCQKDKEHTPPYYYCMRCDSMHCGSCWLNESKHQDTSHEKTRPDDAVLVHTTLRSLLKYYHLLKEAIECLPQVQSPAESDRQGGGCQWFGITPKNSSGDYLLTEGPAYEEIMLGPFGSCSPTTYPGLVSFVGETGAGKSTLISLLIKLSSRQENTVFPFTTPAVGPATSRDSTSSNVHLYVDPKTFSTDSPMLYADCEGMDGDEIPSGMRDSNAFDSKNSQNLAYYNPQTIKWDESMNYGKTPTRKSITKILFPRILYIFSDVIVYIPQNRIRLQDTLVHLVQWAHNATEQSYNKPILPSVIIVSMNKDGQVEDEDFDVEKAKKSVYEKLERFREIGELAPYIEYWEKNNHKISSVEELLKCYYYSVSVVNFPNGEMPTKMLEQTKTLYTEISTACQDSQQRRKDSWMQLNACIFPQCVRKAFTQFASNCKDPFDFSDAWVDLHEISFNLQGSIYDLASKIGFKKKWRGKTIWIKIAGFVASCLLLSCCRNNIPWKRNEKPVLHKTLWDQCLKAAEQYWNLSWPCEYTEDGLGNCLNGPKSHVQHYFYQQGKNNNKPKAANGGHIPLDKMNSKDLQEMFKDHIEKSLADCVGKTEMRDHHPESPGQVFSAHLKRTRSFYKELGNIDDFITHSTCLVCLNGIPEHCLPCGHAICSACTMAFGTPIKGGFVKLRACPLQEHQNDYWSGAWIGCIKPEQAGLRILTLDGGGIKGIVELEILKRIQEHLGPIHLQGLFDLVVGTSAGGIIACALGPGGLDLEQCTEKFLSLSTRAFSKSAVSSIPIIGNILEQMSTFFSHGRYTASSLEQALKEVFPENLGLFGGISSFTTVPLKVAVTTATRQSRAIVLSNYNRKPPKRSFYYFQRPSLIENEMKVWEAARATSAAPTYFSPFKHPATKQEYLDGGLFHNNPIRIAEAESKAIWPSNKQPHPDIVLSVGAGYHNTELTAAVNEQRDSEHIVRDTFMDTSRSTSAADSSTYFHFLHEIVSSQFSNSLNCERIWNDWIEARAPDPKSERRYRRLNVELGRPVNMDEISEDVIKACRDAVANRPVDEFQDIADQLIASCFFYRFGKEDILKIKESFECSGSIECRLLPENVKLLGQHLEQLCSESSTFRPFFFIKETHTKPGERIWLDANIINKMKSEGDFHLDRKVLISSELAETEIFLILRNNRQRQEDIFHISGFPRKLQNDYEVDFTRTGTVEGLIHRILFRVRSDLTRIAGEEKRLLLSTLEDEEVERSKNKKLSWKEKLHLR